MATSAANNSSNTNHNHDNDDHSQHQQQQQQQTMLGTDNDEAATNCSETMSTANEADEECFGLAHAVQANAIDGQTPVCTSAQFAPLGGGGLNEQLSARPQQQRAALEGCPGDIQQSDTSLVGGAGQSAERLTVSPQVTDEGGGSQSRSDLSSWTTQAPPSYGTATRVCATLDAGQLGMDSSLAVAQVQVHQPSQREQQPQLQAAAHAFRFTSSAASQHYNFAPLAFSNAQKQQQELAVVTTAANHYSNEGSMRAHPPLFNGLTTGQGGSPSVPFGGIRPPGPFQAHPLARAHTTIGGQHLSGRAGFMAPQMDGFGSSSHSVAADDFATAGGQHLNSLRRDNNQGSEPRAWPKQQQQQQVAGFAPINHVISAHGSILWQPQTNQCYAPGSLTNAQASTTSARAAPIEWPQQQQQQQGWAHLQLGKSSRKSARIMDGQVSLSSTQLDVDQHQQPLHQQQQPATNRDEPQGWRPKPLALPPSSISAASVTQSATADSEAARKNNQRTFTLASIQRPQQPPAHGNNNNDTPSAARLQMLAQGLPAGRSDESLDQLPRPNPQQQQQAHRKRRRHRSTSGRSVSPDSGGGQLATPCGEEAAESGPQAPSATTLGTVGRAPNLRQQAIGAHCWLIDSSDDQTYGPASKAGSRTTHQSSSRTTKGAGSSVNSDSKLLQKNALPEPPPPAQTHLTVAMMKQTFEQQRLKQQQSASENVHHQYPSTKSLAASRMSLKSKLGAADHLDDEDLDLTVSLRTNSLRMERILNRGEASNRDANHHRVLTINKTLAGNCTMPARRTQQHNKQRRRYSSSSSSTSPGGSPGNHSGVSKRRSKAGTRLSSLLSLVTKLVKRGGSLGAPTARGSGVYPNEPDPDDEYYPQPPPPPPANSISGSVFLRQGQPLPAGPHTYIACSSLGISSSSSTSAYATESSHPSSGGHHQGLAHLLHGSRPSDRPMQLALLHKAASGLPPSGASTAGSSLFYSSSGASAVPPSTGGSHSYEYCDDDRINQIETRFVQPIGVDKHADPIIQDRGGGSGQSGSSDCNKEADEEEDSTEIAASLPGASSSGAKLHQTSTLMSDNELLSAGSEAGFPARRAPLAQPTLAARVSQAAPSAARRRWWWISIRDMLCRRPCNGQPGDGGSTGDSEAGAIEEREPAQRYKSLKSRRRRHHHHQAGGPSTLKNVLSLAKADRVFRRRLLASLLVSCVLIGLIGLLCGLVYSRSSILYRERQRLGLYLDGDLDPDYDLSWLWPPPSSHQAADYSPPPLAQQSASSPRYRVLDLAAAHHRNPAELLMMDTALRGPLLMIEQSERLAQFQLTMTHLTNLQLAGDSFIDLTQVASRLGFVAAAEETIHQTANFTPTSDALRNQSSRFETAARPHLLQLSDAELDLISLVLLSNLHWPLVKWRHQNQQSVASFLSFALPSPAATAGQSHLRGLLPALLLADASRELPVEAANNSNLHQFAQLNAQLRTSSHHLASCAARQLSGAAEASFQPQSASSLRARFCEQLVARYRRMMFTLSQLNHSQLVKLREPVEQPPTLLGGDMTNGAQQTASQPFASSRTLLSFLLDRLALLDVQTVAEATLAQVGDADDLEEFASAPDEEDSSASGGSELHELESRALASILSSEQQQQQMDPSRQPAANKWQHSAGSLLDLAKATIGDAPTRPDPSDLERDNEWAARLQHLEADSHEAWRELLSRDLLHPWATGNLPRFLTPLSYDLFLHPNLTTRLVLGMVKMSFRLERPTRFIVLHCDRLNLVDVSLWLKQEPQALNRSLHAGLPSAGGDSTLVRVPIRRVVRNAKLEQIYIELQNQINPARRASTGHTAHPAASALNFGGELPLQPTVGSSGESHYILSISFNKTSLVQQPDASPGSPPPLPAEAHQPEGGLEFVQYADYFAQTDTELKTLMYTRFEPQNARRLFPCLDEPHLKARFQLNLVHEQGHQVLFNAPKRERVPYTADGAHQMSVFEATPIPLSTYLVAFVVCDAQNMKSITSRVAQLQPLAMTRAEPRHIQVQVLAQFEQLGQAEFASQLVPQLLAFYQSHLNCAYPVDKLDLVAIPRAAVPARTNPPASRLISQQQQLPISGSQQVNTMENLGLIWFKANLLLVDTNLISQNLIEQVAMIISHQLAHQYFGNMVSIWRWDDLWLYESLCQYLESVALSSVQPDWRLEEQFVVTSIQDTLASEQFNWPAAATVLDHQSPGTASDQQLSTLKQAVNLEQLISQRADNSPTGEDEEFQAPGVELQPELPDELWGSQRSSGRTGAQSSLQSEVELRRGSALLHMLLFNLLPSHEARARLLRRCLSLFRYGTMSRAQFWRQFGEQLAQEGSSGRLMLSIDSGTISGSLEPMINADRLSLPISDQWRNSSGAILEPQLNADQVPQSPSERVVFVRPSLARRRSQVPGDIHRIHVRSADRLTRSLELTVEAWLERRGYPLITASISRDRIQLRQERFTFAWWNEPGLVDEEPIGPGDSMMSPDGSGGHLATAQRNRRAASPGPDLGPIWPIPLMLVSRINQKQPQFLWMDKRELEIPLQDLSYPLSSPSKSHQDSLVGPLMESSASRRGHLNSWFKLNVNQSSLVRVNYDERNWEALTEVLLKSHYSNHLLSPLDRANLIDDAMTLMRCGKLSVGIAMNLTLYLEVGEREFMPWTSALRHLDQMQTLLNQNPLWHRYVLKLMQPISSVIGWKDDGPHLMRKLRRSMFSVALQYGDERTVNKAKQEFKSWFKSGRFIVPNLQELVYVAGVRYGDQQEWLHCWQRYTQLGLIAQNQSGNSAGDGGKSSPLLASVTSSIGSLTSEFNEPNAENEKRQLLTALASTHNTWLLEQFLNYSMDPSKIESHHLKHVMQTLGKNSVARLYLWRFVRLNWNSLIDRSIDNYPNSAKGSRDNGYHRVLATMIVESTKHFVTKLDYEEVKMFFETKRKQHKLRPDLNGWSPSLEGAIQQSLQVIRANIYWRNYIEPKLTKWLSHFDSSMMN